jgi:hypothetical protein
MYNLRKKEGSKASAEPDREPKEERKEGKERVVEGVDLMNKQARKDHNGARLEET